MKKTIEYSRKWDSCVDKTRFAPFANGIDKMASEDIQNFATKSQLRPSGQVGPWGFVCFRLDFTDESAWNRINFGLTCQLEDN